MNPRIPIVVALVGALLGLLFATYSTLDYANHLDRQLHDVHCSVIPGAPPKAEAEGCRAALYSPYSSVLKDALWGGIPISLFAQGSFAFFAGFAVYLLIAGEQASKAAAIFFAAVAVTPLIVSIAMFAISILELGELCQTCVGTYISSFLVALGGVVGLVGLGRRPRGSALLAFAWLAALGVFTLAPTAVYAAAAPDHSPYLEKCGALAKPDAPAGVLVPIKGRSSVMRAVFFEDPLCATCKAVHLRLKSDHVLDKLDTDLVLLPLDNRCNWMLDRPMHPGACSVAKAILCGGDRAAAVLEWAYEEQTYLLRAGKADLDANRADEPVLKEVLRRRWGDDLVRCLDTKETAQRLNQHLQFAVDNSVAVSTPQIYLAGKRVCDEDTDLGLRFALRRLAPEVMR